MSIKIKNPEDFWSGVMFIVFGIIAVAVSRDYPMGSAMRMGPGYFPTWLGIGTVVLGAIIAIKALQTQGQKIKPFAWRAMILLALAFAIVGWGIDHIGFIPSLFLMIICATLAGREFRLVETLILSAVLIGGSVGLFIYGLELPFPLFWWR